MSILSKFSVPILGPLLVSIALVGAGVALGMVQITAPHEEASVLGEAVRTSTAIPLAIETVGANTAADGASLGTSWPGEITSLGDLEVQPLREGTIVEWFVGVGQHVRRGQAIARLGAPPAGPDITQMLAEQAKMVSETRSEAVAMEHYAEKNTKQLLTLRASLDKNKMDVAAILQTDASSNRSKINGLTSDVVGLTSDVVGLQKRAVLQARDVVAIAQKKVRTTIEQALTSEFPEIVSNPKDPVSAFRARGYFTTVFDSTIGVLDSAARQQFATASLSLLNALKDPAALPEEATLAYFQAANRVVLASVPSTNISESTLSDLRKMIADDKSEFLMAMADVEEAKTELAMKETEAKMKETDVKMKETDAKMKETDYAMNQTETDKDFAMQKKEIDEKISMLERDVELAKGKARAAEVSYGTVVRGLTEGLNIVALRDGVVSVILKKNGDFVGPGMAVASLNSGNISQRFVRFRIPSNLRAPALGDILTINRPGFPTEVKKVKVTGIGTALDQNGSYVADADFVDRTDWPVGASVRVMPPSSDAGTNFIPLSALWWSEDGTARVWIVEKNILHARTIMTGRALSDSIEVTNGLKPGDVYVSKPLPNLQDGTAAVGTSSGASSDQQTKPASHGHDE